MHKRKPDRGFGIPSRDILFGKENISEFLSGNKATKLANDASFTTQSSLTRHSSFTLDHSSPAISV